jgi:predicted nucleic acid-binding protein
MSGFLLDTNVLSEVLRKRPSASVLSRLATIPAASLHTSSICVMELRFGAARHSSGTELWNRIARDVLPRVTVLHVGQEEAVRAGEVMARLEARGRRIGVSDVLIAATALCHDLTLATRNLKDLGRVDDLSLESWWD